MFVRCPFIVHFSTWLYHILRYNASQSISSKILYNPCSNGIFLLIIFRLCINFCKSSPQAVDLQHLPGKRCFSLRAGRNALKTSSRAYAWHTRLYCPRMRSPRTRVLPVLRTAHTLVLPELRTAHTCELLAHACATRARALLTLRTARTCELLAHLPTILRAIAKEMEICFLRAAIH